jgi:hypothetical protein
MIRLLAHAPLSPVSKLPLFFSLPCLPLVEFIDGGGGGGGAKSGESLALCKSFNTLCCRLSLNDPLGLTNDP